MFILTYSYATYVTVTKVEPTIVNLNMFLCMYVFYALTVATEVTKLEYIHRCMIVADKTHRKIRYMKIVLR